MARWYHSAARQGMSGQKTPKGNSNLRSFLAIVFILSVVGRCWVNFHGKCKVDGL